MEPHWLPTTIGIPAAGIALVYLFAGVEHKGSGQVVGSHAPQSHDRDSRV